ncbi:MAG: TlpA family protein disulfide reductase [Herminiimonas sp.]|nr:TlpA family protein disulfide reductase [Herminiimonas sp.]
MKRNVAIAVVIGLLFAGAGMYFGAQAPIGQVPAVAKSAGETPDLFGRSLPDASGTPQSLAQWKGKPVVVNFWATWCAPCVQEMPELSALQTEIAPRKVQILGIGIDSPTNIKEFASKYKISYPLYVAGMEGTELARQYGNQAGGLPYTVLIGADGKVRKTYLGKLKMDELRRDIAGL